MAAPSHNRAKASSRKTDQFKKLTATDICPIVLQLDELTPHHSVSTAARFNCGSNDASNVQIQTSEYPHCRSPEELLEATQASIYKLSNCQLTGAVPM